MRKGKLFIISGPSGAGKGTICNEILNMMPDVFVSVSMTTRNPRQGEVPDVSYHFVSKDQFEKIIKEDGFFEYANVHSNYYGTPKAPVMEQIEKGNDAILEIDVQGALQVKEVYPEAVTIFILPPSMEELKNRIVGRGTETEETIKLRLKNAIGEISCVDKYDYAVLNDQLEIAVEQVASVMKAEHVKVSEELLKVTQQYKEEM